MSKKDKIFRDEKLENVNSQSISLVKLIKPSFNTRSIIEPDSIVKIGNSINGVGIFDP